MREVIHSALDLEWAGFLAGETFKVDGGAHGTLMRRWPGGVRCGAKATRGNIELKLLASRKAVGAAEVKFVPQDTRSCTERWRLSLPAKIRVARYHWFNRSTRIF